MKRQKVRTKLTGLSVLGKENNFRIGGWLCHGKYAYLSFWFQDKYLGSLEGQCLYRLAKAIVRRFEGK